MLQPLPFADALRASLSRPTLLAVWAAFVVASLALLWWDIRQHNRALPSLMKLVWTLVVLYSGPLGIGLYWYAGRTQIDTDSLWRRGVRSTAHCYSGCGAGEVLGVLFFAGILALGGSLVTLAGTFALAYTFGYALTVGPLVQEGVGLREAVLDALWSETPSITVMEVTAIGIDTILAGEATMGEPLFWGALAFSLTLGFVAAFPVNTALVHTGVKEGMDNPATMAG